MINFFQVNEYETSAICSKNIESSETINSNYLIAILAFICSLESLHSYIYQLFAIVTIINIDFSIVFIIN